MLRSNAEVERYLLNRLEAERIAVEGPRTLRSRPPPRVREPVVNLDGIMSDLSDEEEEEDEDEDGDASEEEGVGGRGSRPARKKARKSAGQAAGGKSDGKPQKVLTPVSSEEQVKRYLYRTAKGQFGPFSLADFRGWKETMKQKGACVCCARGVQATAGADSLSLCFQACGPPSRCSRSPRTRSRPSPSPPSWAAELVTRAYSYRHGVGCVCWILTRIIARTCAVVPRPLLRIPSPLRIATLPTAAGASRPGR